MEKKKKVPLGAPQNWTDGSFRMQNEQKQILKPLPHRNGLLRKCLSIGQAGPNPPSVIRILSGGVIFLTRLHIDGPVIVRVTLFLAFGRSLHQAKVDGHQIVILVVCVGNAGAAVTQPEAPQSLGQVTCEGSSATLADDRTVGSVHLQSHTQPVSALHLALSATTSASPRRFCPGALRHARTLPTSPLPRLALLGML